MQGLRAILMPFLCSCGQDLIARYFFLLSRGEPLVEASHTGERGKVKQGPKANEHGKIKEQKAYMAVAVRAMYMQKSLSLVLFSFYFYQAKYPLRETIDWIKPAGASRNTIIAITNKKTPELQGKGEHISVYIKHKGDRPCLLVAATSNTNRNGNFLDVI